MKVTFFGLKPPPVPPWGMIGYVLRLAVLVEYLKHTRLTHILHSSFYILHFEDSSFIILHLMNFSLKKR